MADDPFNEALALHRQGRLKDAERRYKASVKRDPERTDGWFLLGMVQAQREDWTSAASNFRQAVRLDPNHAQAHNNLGLTLMSLDRPAEAIGCFQTALAIKPDFFEAHNNLGRALKESGEVLRAIESFSRCIEIEATCADAYFNLGLAYVDLMRPQDAIAAFQKATQFNPNDAEAFSNLGVTLLSLRRVTEAIYAYQRAISLAPEFVEAHYNLGNALSTAGNAEAAVKAYRTAIKLSPDHIAARYNLVATLLELRRYDDALEIAQAILERDPHYRGVLGQVAFAQLAKCDWAGARATISSIEQLIADGGFVDPFTALACGLSPAAQFACGSRVLEKNDSASFQAPAPTIDPTGKLRIAYISPDYHEHPVASAIVRLFELHDRTKFDVIGVSLLPGDGRATRARIEKSVDRMIDVSQMNDSDAAQELRNANVHIAIDLAGYTRHARFGLFRQRLAPIQVNYLGFSGTIGADFLDYIIADKTALPSEQQSYFSERIVHLPESFMSYDTNRTIAPGPVSRLQAGLPDDGFVFCCFNQSFKFAAPVFDIWMRLLRSVKGSVLWISRQQEAVRSTLKNEASQRGVDPERLIFADRVEKIEDHLARLGAADLFLDTLPYNAHATAADAIWAGVPVLTCAGDTFAGRVAASLARAAGISELVTQNAQDYEDVAIKLANDRERLQSYKARLLASRLNGELFNADTFRRRFEAALAKMWDIHRSGERPTSFSVDF